MESKIEQKKKELELKEENQRKNLEEIKKEKYLYNLEKQKKNQLTIETSIFNDMKTFSKEKNKTISSIQFPKTKKKRKKKLSEIETETKNNIKLTKCSKYK